MGGQGCRALFPNPEHVYAQAGCIGSGRAENSPFSPDAGLFQQPVVSGSLVIPCRRPVSLTWFNNPVGGE